MPVLIFLRGSHLLPIHGASVYNDQRSFIFFLSTPWEQLTLRVPCRETQDSRRQESSWERPLPGHILAGKRSVSLKTNERASEEEVQGQDEDNGDWLQSCASGFKYNTAPSSRSSLGHKVLDVGKWRRGWSDRQKPKQRLYTISTGEEGLTIPDINISLTDLEEYISFSGSAWGPPISCMWMRTREQ